LGTKGLRAVTNNEAFCLSKAEERKQWTSDKWNRVENPETDCLFYSQVISGKGTKSFQQRKVSFQLMVLEQFDTQSARKSTPCTINTH
jgi:hypothetical protein